MNTTADPVNVADLLDEAQMLDLRINLIMSAAAPRRYVAWHQERQTLVVLDLDKGEIVRARSGPCETREIAKDAIAELQMAIH